MAETMAKTDQIMSLNENVVTYFSKATFKPGMPSVYASVFKQILLLSVIQDPEREPVPAGPVPDALREHAEPAQDVTESESSDDDDVQNSSQDEDSQLKWPEDEKSQQILDENNSDVREKNYLDLPIFNSLDDVP